MRAARKLDRRWWRKRQEPQLLLTTGSQVASDLGRQRRLVPRARGRPRGRKDGATGNEPETSRRNAARPHYVESITRRPCPPALAGIDRRRNEVDGCVRRDLHEEVVGV